ncbi:MAG: tripartite tricarboxylate transporter substrate binding protein [Betaproteobacteria bacterium]
MAVVAALLAPLAAAQQPAYPAKTIRMIASQAPGGGIDTVCRIVAPKLSDALGQTVIVENRAGANGSLAAEFTAKAPPDGYVIMLGAVGNLGTNAIFYKPLTYDPVHDLAPITSAVLSANVLVVHPSVPARSVKELIALAKAQPNSLAYGTSGTGGAGHLAGALFSSMTHTKLLHVPYKGGGPAMVDLVAGQVQIVFASQPSSAVFIRSGRIRALAVTTAHRLNLFPEIPTLAEAGVPGYVSQAWYGFVAPAKTPPPIISRLNEEIVRILHAPDVMQTVVGQGLEVWTMKPDAFGAYIKSEVDKWTRVIREVGASEK